MEGGRDRCLHDRLRVPVSAELGSSSRSIAVLREGGMEGGREGEVG